MNRSITQDDLVAAQRGCRMAGLPLVDLDQLMEEHPEDSPTFASRVIYAAARQMRWVKRLMGAQL